MTLQDAGRTTQRPTLPIGVSTGISTRLPFVTVELSLIDGPFRTS